ncbi:MAG: hypothetical protein COA90_00840 [Gammaproteobacteria bacterium]|nr:MAG: hypothetical protein COA90_00840 [Gammaproteobacteria bacterium]
MLKKLVILLFISLLSVQISHAEGDELPLFSGIGGSFSAVDADGKAVEFSDFEGQVVVLSFGYTNCADICPFTLGYLARLYSKLTEEEQTKVQIIFVTIDPEYDTPGHLKQFIGHFNSDFVGLSGSKEQIDYIVSLFQAKYQKLSVLNTVPTKNIRRVTPKLFSDESDEEDKASLYSHSVTLYLIDKSGFTRSLEYTGTPVDEFVSKIRGLINE